MKRRCTLRLSWLQLLKLCDDRCITGYYSWLLLSVSLIKSSEYDFTSLVGGLSSFPWVSNTNLTNSDSELQSKSKNSRRRFFPLYYEPREDKQDYWLMIWIGPPSAIEFRGDAQITPVSSAERVLILHSLELNESNLSLLRSAKTLLNLNWLFWA